MTDEQKAKVTEMQAVAWRAISSRLSMCEQSRNKTDRDRLINVDVLLMEVARQRKMIDKFIDSCPE